jgi:hypothetical protein
VKLVVLPNYSLTDSLQELLNTTSPNYTEEQKILFLTGFQYGFGLMKMGMSRWGFFQRLRFLLFGGG